MPDSCTVISLVPFPINESKPGLYPGHFKIPPAKNNDFEALIVGRSVHYVYLDEDRGSVQVPTPSDEVARSICEDYITDIFGVQKGVAEPGIFFIDGAYVQKDGEPDKKTIAQIAKDKIEQARARQRQWFVHLVEIADDEWSKYHTHKSISDLQRFAAKILGLEREWNVDAKVESTGFCPACKMTVQVGAMICGNCRTVIDKEAYQKAGFTQV